MVRGLGLEVTRLSSFETIRKRITRRMRFDRILDGDAPSRRRGESEKPPFRGCGTGAPSWRRCVGSSAQYAAPPAFAGAFSSGISETSASVVSRSVAIEAAFWSALRVTLVGSMMPRFTMSQYSSVAAS